MFSLIYLFFMISSLRLISASPQWGYPFSPFGSDSFSLYSNSPYVVPDFSNSNYKGQRSFASCEKYIEYHQEDYYGGYIGVLSIPDPDIPKSKTKIILTVAAQLNSDYAGRIDLLNSNEDSASDLSNGYPLKLKVTFPIQNPLPQVKELHYNDQLLCKAPAVAGAFVTTLTLRHTFNANVPRRATQKSQFQSTTSQPNFNNYGNYYESKFTTSSPSETNAAILEEIHSQCGEADYDIGPGVGLVRGGEEAIRCQFPWLISYFHQTSVKLKFICGGSLVSTKIVVTAAHCIFHKKSSEQRKPEDATLIAGKHDITKLIEDYNQIRKASKFIIHPDWDASAEDYDSDIAIVVLTEAIQFNKFVKPICIWKRTFSYEDMIGANGEVAGWGVAKENDIASEKPMFTKLPVVKNIDCHRSHPSLKQISSDKTFCAGIRNSDTGPCLGDSGGAFVFGYNNRSYLRGIVSSALRDPSMQTCDNNNYAVFTDTSKFTQWIEKYMKKYG